ncbi:hypothetical protein [Actinotalea fermentans]|uniref:Uncharacterized protein n=1 Tax=Actinotalea fermentans TaxID=43671 RepID=A0A511YY08_9CELL|nr:hypothetical protein [Actinotalea fermentans]GEN80095.1 hypothetical protein AFE02nite_18290 [Actinotalea fermentans]
MSPDQQSSRDLHAPRDLHDLFAAAGAAERAAADALDVAALRRLAHRRRAVRGTTYSAVGVAAAAAIAMGVLGPGGLGDDRPLPPADSPTATPTPGTWPAAVTLDGPVPACGDPMPALVTPDGEPELTIEQITQGAPLVAGGVAQLDVTIHAPEGVALQSSLPRPLLVRDGVVVATLDRDVDLSSTYGGSGDLGFPPVLLELVRCETQGHGAVPLDGGDYDLVVLQVLTRADATGAIEQLTLAGGPYPITLESAATDESPGS